MQDRISKAIQDSCNLKSKIARDPQFIRTIERAAVACIDAIRRDHRIFFCGNGGSAADAQHLAAELSGRYYYDRPPLYAEALNVNMSYITAVGNDYGYDAIFERSLQAKGRPGDVLFGLSTSGNSANVVRAFQFARNSEVVTIGMTGQDGGKLRPLSDHLFLIPSSGYAAYPGMPPHDRPHHLRIDRSGYFPQKFLVQIPFFYI